MPDSSSTLSTLLNNAGIEFPIKSIEPINKGITNRVSLIKLINGEQLVFREYQWPHPTSNDLKRLKKEEFIHNLLQTNGVPVPKILATSEREGEGAILMEYVSGSLLGDALRVIPEEQQRHAWRVSGEALKQAHSIRLSENTAGVIVGNTLKPFPEGSWGHYHLHNTLHHARRVLAFRPNFRIDLDLLESILIYAIPILDDTSFVLLHNDPHPWNVLVQERGGTWACTAWLDWEYAWVGDPTWDLVRMDIFRVKPLGPTPSDFYEGYGAYPQEPHRSIYELAIYLWMYNQYLSGDRALMPTYKAAMKYMDHIGMSIQTIYEELNPNFNRGNR